MVEIFNFEERSRELSIWLLDLVSGLSHFWL